MQLVRLALGEDWRVEGESLRIKPLRVRALHDEDEVVFTWGPDRDLKHLVWAALQAGANGDQTRWVLCVVDTFTKPVPANVRQAHLRIAASCNLRLLHLTACGLKSGLRGSTVGLLTRVPQAHKPF